MTKKMHMGVFDEVEQGNVKKMFLRLVLDFDPDSGKETDIYNPQHKWFVPGASVTESSLILKQKADNVLLTKERLMKQIGITEWDTSDYQELTESDKLVFSKLRMPLTTGATFTVDTDKESVD